MEAISVEKNGRKKTNFGYVPIEWDMQTLKSVSSFRRGSFPQPYGLAKWYDDENGFPFVQVYDVGGDFKLKKSTKRRISKIAIEKSVLVKKGTLVLTIQGSIGRVAELHYDACVDRTLLIFTSLSAQLDKKYFMYSIHRLFDIEKRLAPGGTIKTITKEKLSNFEIPILPKDMQIKIADILGTWDGAIEQATNLIEKLKARKKGLEQQLLTGKKRLKGYTDKWCKMPISKVAEQYSVKNKKDEDIVVLSCTKYDGLVPSLEYFGRKVYGDDTSKYKVVPNGYFAYATNHIEEGSIGLQSKLENGLVSPMYTVFKTGKSINAPFFYRLLKTDRMIYMYQSKMSGSIARRGGLRWDAFKTIDIKVPSYQEQVAIEEIFDKVDTEIQVAENYLSSLKTQKKGLMQQLLTGQKRVSVN